MRLSRFTITAVAVFTLISISCLGSTPLRPKETSAVYEVTDPSGFSAVYALSDVHGMLASVQKTLRAAHLIDSKDHWIGGQALLLVIGDSIDKGPDSIGVIDLWRGLAREAAAAGGAVVHLLGNHEAELLADPANNLSDTLSSELRSKGLSVSDLTSPSSPRGEFLRKEPVGARVGNWLFCHAGHLPNMNWAEFKAKAAEVLGQGDYANSFLQDPNSVLEIKDWWKQKPDREAYLKALEQDGMIGVVQGHQPKALGIDFKIGSTKGGHFIKIDCGAYPDEGSNPIEILEFPHPKQLSTQNIPDALVIDQDGNVRSLR